MNLSQDSANGLIVTSLAVSGGIVIVRHAKDGTAPPARLVVGLAVAGVGLATLGQISPSIAGGLALLVLTTSALVYGGPTWQALAEATSATPASSSTPKPQQPRTIQA